MNLSRMKLGTKLIGGFGTIIGFLAIIVLVSIDTSKGQAGDM